MKNYVSVIGRIGKNMNARQFEDGSRVVNFSIAVDDSYYNDKGERVERTQWIDTTARNNVADLIVKHFNTGDQIGVTGKLIKRSYKHPNFDLDISVTEVLVFEVTFEASRASQKNYEEKQKQQQKKQ